MRTVPLTLNPLYTVPGFNDMLVTVKDWTTVVTVLVTPCRVADTTTEVSDPTLKVDADTSTVVWFAGTLALEGRLSAAGTDELN